MILVDAGPLVAIVDADDQHHEQCVDALQRMEEPLGTVWPAIIEAFYLLRDTLKGQEAVWEILSRGTVALLPLDSPDFPRMRELMRKYSDHPMDLADAALIRVAEREGIRRFFTVDRKDFAVYRLHGRIRPITLP